MADNRPQTTVNSTQLVFWNFKPYFIRLQVRKRTYIKKIITFYAIILSSSLRDLKAGSDCPPWRGWNNYRKRRTCVLSKPRRGKINLKAIFLLASPDLLQQSSSLIWEIIAQKSPMEAVLDPLDFWNSAYQFLLLHSRVKCAFRQIHFQIQKVVHHYGHIYQTHFLNICIFPDSGTPSDKSGLDSLH